jgi:hypothetical protein
MLTVAAQKCGGDCKKAQNDEIILGLIYSKAIHYTVFEVV